jgi:acetyl esterase/lipase
MPPLRQLNGAAFGQRFPLLNPQRVPLPIMRPPFLLARFPDAPAVFLSLALTGTLGAVEPAASPAPSTAAASLVTTIPAKSIRLWEGDAPGALGQQPQDIPTLTPYPANGGNRTGASMIVLPGGGYANLAAHEGGGYAEWLASQGITAYLLRYRLGSQGYHHPVELGDVARAVRMVRSFAQKRDDLDPSRVGLIGSSAGGHLAATIATHFDSGQGSATDPIERESSRPDLVVLCYPVITFGEFAHAGSRTQLLGRDPPADLLLALSAELQVTKETPPTFLWHTMDDASVPVENSLLFAAALRRNGVPFSLHIYETGAHGLGLGRPGRPAPPWADQLLYWFKERKFIP